MQIEKDIAKKTEQRKSVRSKPNAEKAGEKQKKFLSDKESREKRLAAAKGFFGALHLASVTRTESARSIA